MNRNDIIFKMCLNEACRQWCGFIDDEPERKNGEGFAEFFNEIYDEKADTYRKSKKMNIAEEGLLL